MKRSRVKALWAEGKPACCVLIKIKDPRVAELASLIGFDCLWFDLEHHCISVETAENMMRAARVGVSDVMARPAKGEVMRMGRLLEAGAQGILYPRVETVEEARDLVRWAKFAPLGERGFDGGNADSPYGGMDMASYVAAANRETFVFAQIESPAAVSQARAIAEIEGVDGLFFGPGDFSVLAGIPGQFQSETVQSAIRHVCREARAAGKQFGTLAFSRDQAARLLDQGATFVSLNYDLGMLKCSMETLAGQFAALGFSLEGSRHQEAAGSEYSKSSQRSQENAI